MSSTPFFIWFVARSGSTHLMSLLDSHRDIVCKDELYCGNNVRDAVRFPSLESIHEPLKQLYERETLEAAGFKLSLGQMRTYPEVWEYLVERNNTMRCICLYRENILKQEISWQIASTAIQQSAGSCHIHKDEAPPNIGNVQIDIPLCLQRLPHWDNRQKALIQFAAAFPQMHTMTYESILYKEADTLQDVQRFLGVEPVSLTSKLQKIMPDNLQSVIRNYDELCTALNDTPWEQFLYPVSM